MNHLEPTHQSQIKARDVTLRSQSAWMRTCTHTGAGHFLEVCRRRFVCFKRLNADLQLRYRQDLATGEPGSLFSLFFPSLTHTDTHTHTKSNSLSPYLTPNKPCHLDLQRALQP